MVLIHFMQNAQGLFRGISDDFLGSLLLGFASFLRSKTLPALMIMLDGLLKHFLILLCGHLICFAIFPDLLAKHFYQQFQLGRRHFHIRQLLIIFRAENILGFSILQNAFRCIVPKCFFNHLRHTAVHDISIHFGIGSVHLTHKSRNGHEALSEGRFFFAYLTEWLTNIIRRPHSFDGFQEIRLE